MSCARGGAHLRLDRVPEQVEDDVAKQIRPKQEDSGVIIP